MSKSLSPSIVARNSTHVFGLVLALSSYNWSEKRATIQRQFEARKCFITGGNYDCYQYKDETGNVVEISKEEALGFIDEYEVYLHSVCDEVKKTHFQEVAAALHSIIKSYDENWKEKLGDSLSFLERERSLPFVRMYGAEHFSSIEAGMSDVEISDAIIRSKMGEIPRLHVDMKIAS